MKKIIIWQCKDWCCEDRPFPERWWNARIQGDGGYHSAYTQFRVWQLANDDLHAKGIL